MQIKMETNQLLIEAAKPLVMYLRKTCNPHVKVIVDQTGAEVVEGILSTGRAFDGSNPKQILDEVNLIKWVVKTLSGEQLNDEQAELVLSKYKI